MQPAASCSWDQRASTGAQLSEGAAADISQPQARRSRGARVAGYRSPAHLRAHIRALEPGRDVLHRRDDGDEEINSLETRGAERRARSAEKSRIVLDQRASSSLEDLLSLLLSSVRRDRTRS